MSSCTFEFDTPWTALAHEGLYSFDIRHMPQGCATWPAAWETDDTNWPSAGEVDIVSTQYRLSRAIHDTIPIRSLAALLVYSK